MAKKKKQKKTASGEKPTHAYGKESAKGTATSGIGTTPDMLPPS